MGQGFGGSTHLRCQTDQIKQLFGPLHMQPSGGRPALPTLLGMGAQCHLHVFQNSHAVKYPGDLKGAAHAQAGQCVRCKARHVATIKPNAARIGLQQARQGVEKSAFASAVGADDGVELPGLDMHVHVLQGLQAPKAFGYALNLQNIFTGRCAHASPFLKRPTKPVGMSKTSNTMMMPIASGQYSVLPLIITSSTT